MNNIKKKIKSLVGIAVSHEGIGTLLNSFSRDIATVFLLHRAAGVSDGIHGHDPETLEQMLVAFRRAYFNLVPLREVVEAARGARELPPRTVAFTMDDGYRDQLEILAPIFVKHGVPLTVFLATGFIDGEVWPWDAKIHWMILKTKKERVEIPIGRQKFDWAMESPGEKLLARREMQEIASTLPNGKLGQFLNDLEIATGVKTPAHAPAEFKPATWEQVKALEKQGVDFGPHTHSHLVLSRLTDDQARRELEESFLRLKSETSHSVPFLAYPVGMHQHFGSREVALASEIGMAAAFAVRNGYSRWKDAQKQLAKRFVLERFCLPETFEESAWIASGLECLRQKFGSGIKINRCWKGGQICLDDGFDPEKISRWIFVCKGNVCRSPYAETIAKNLGVNAVSCGTDVIVSRPVEDMACLAAQLKGHDISRHMSKSIFEIDIRDSDCLVIMDPRQSKIVGKMKKKFNCKVTALWSWSNRQEKEIHDPYGKRINEFLKCYETIEKAVNNMILKFREG